MASSRWKRFAFFDRNTLNIKTEVMKDLVPDLDVDSDVNPKDGENPVTMVVTTAGLPLSTQRQAGISKDSENQEGSSVKSLDAMWSTLTACTAPQDLGREGTVNLPSQSLQFEDMSDDTQPVQVKDGLVLVFVTSHESDIVHCVDITVRCNPHESKTAPEDDLDGWRGYWSPFSGERSQAGSARSETKADSDASFLGERITGIAACREGAKLLIATVSETNVIVDVNPHLYLSCRLPIGHWRSKGSRYKLTSPWNDTQLGRCQCVDVVPGFLVVGTGMGFAVLYFIRGGSLRPFMTIPSPSSGAEVTSVRLDYEPSKLSLFVCYDRKGSETSRGSFGGVCCFDLGSPSGPGFSSSPSARYDLDSRPVQSRRLCDYVINVSGHGNQFMVSRQDGLYSFSHTQKVGVSPIDGPKLAVCAVPSPLVLKKTTPVSDSVGSTYTLVASTDSKSGRDAIDIYDSTNKLVAFHVLLSPGHKALEVAGVTTAHSRMPDGSVRGGRSSTIVLTSGGTIVTLTEKVTNEKVTLLVQKNLFDAAISMAYADPSFQPSEVTALYRRHAEHLYRKGDFSASMDQYIYTIGSLESSHVIFRFLDAPKIPLLTKYLEELRSRGMATLDHNELLRTCYLKLNDNEAAEKIAASTASATDSSSSAPLVATLTDKPKDALATICSMEAPQAAEALVVHGAALARVLPRETAGVVVSLCVGTYSPAALVDAANKAANEASKMLDYAFDERTKRCNPYPVHLFASAFLESPKMLRLILAHCNRNKCYLTPSLRRTLLELTLTEWGSAKRSGDAEAEKLRRKEAITALTDAHCRDVGDYDALVIVQRAGFSEGELLLYERLQMVPMLLSRYAQDGGERARRQMLAMCRNDPEVLADVLAHFVEIASKKTSNERPDDDSIQSEDAEILDDIREALSLARSQALLPPVRIARILAGEGTGRFSVDSTNRKVDGERRTVPLAVALDYVGEILDQSRGEINRLRAEVNEYNELCNGMEAEIEALLSGQPVESVVSTKKHDVSSIDIDELYAKQRHATDDRQSPGNRTMQAREGFWREMNQSEDRFETITRFFAKGIIQ